MRALALVLLLSACAHQHPPVPEVVLSPAWSLPDTDIQPAVVAKARRKYSAYFEAIKRQVHAHWDPVQTFHDLDPDAKKFGSKDRYTLLSVSLTPDGRVSSLVVDRSSEITVLDEFAVAAFQDAAPFPSAPPQLVQHDLVTFKFGFLVEAFRPPPTAKR